MSLSRSSGSSPRGAFSEWSSAVGTLIGQLARVGSGIPERCGCYHGPDQARGVVGPISRGRGFTARSCVRRCVVGTPRSTASCTAHLRPTRVSRRPARVLTARSRSPASGTPSTRPESDLRSSAQPAALKRYGAGGPGASGFGRCGLDVTVVLLSSAFRHGFCAELKKQLPNG